MLIPSIRSPDALKAPFARLLGIAGASALADELLESALASVAPFGRKADVLRALVELVRDHGRLGNRGSPVSQTSQNRRAADE